jgi:hypothetical protein
MVSFHSENCFLAFRFLKLKSIIIQNCNRNFAEIEELKNELERKPEEQKKRNLKFSD